MDFLAGEYGGTGKSRRTQKALDIQPRKARGCDLAFQVAPETVTLRGHLPDGAADEVRVRIASVVPFLVMKGMALEDRRKAKDAYDIYFILQNYPGGVDAVVQAFKPHLKLGLSKRASRKSRENSPRWIMSDPGMLQSSTTRSTKRNVPSAGEMLSKK